MLIRNAEIDFGRRADIRIADGVMTAIGRLAPAPGEAVIDAGGDTLLPGLHDHHIHLLAFAAARDSVRCGPPWVNDEGALAEALQAAALKSGGGWLRGIGYHESVAGEIDRDWLDRVLPLWPARIQHRSGRLWILNSRALDIVAQGDTPLETADGRFTGRLYDNDGWLRERIGATEPPIRAASDFLLSRGVTGITDTTPGNGAPAFDLMAAARRRGDLAQSVLMMGGDGLDRLQERDGVRVGARKFHLHETELPDPVALSADISRSHAAGRATAFHCVTLAELVFALSALEEAGAIQGDRIEHASVAPPDILPWIARLGLTVVSQPNFVAERGDAYLRDVDPLDRPWLYRQRAFREAGILLAAGTDAPFGDADPWKAMEAAVTRRTPDGEVLDAAERLTPEEAVGLFLGDPGDPGGPPRTIAVGAPADLCLLDRPWAQARRGLGQVGITTTIKAGRIVWPR
ncbi:MAG TPA: amidohydrolase family protein [Alphaproteobacteria bacterium]|jgi:predicted amidohydrolase YtcJ|nr:amidohydrolase family protein [Alphaproteobacteria bacterium]